MNSPSFMVFLGLWCCWAHHSFSYRPVLFLYLFGPYSENMNSYQMHINIPFLGYIHLGHKSVYAYSTVDNIQQLFYTGQTSTQHQLLNIISIKSDVFAPLLNLTRKSSLKVLFVTVDGLLLCSLFLFLVSPYLNFSSYPSQCKYCVVQCYPYPYTF